MFSFFKKKSKKIEKTENSLELNNDLEKNWKQRLSLGLSKTRQNISSIFTGTKISDELYEQLEEILLLSDVGINATEYLLQDLRKRVKENKATEINLVQDLLIDCLADLLKPLEKELIIDKFKPTVIMMAGVNGAGKTTSIGKITKHLIDNNQSVLLAAADTFRAAAREQLNVWANRNEVEIISQNQGHPASVCYDAVIAGKARKKDVVILDTAGRLPTQQNLMLEIQKIKKVVNKADENSPHEIILVIDGNTGQNALSQVKSFNESIKLTGLIITKLDGTAKGGILVSIAKNYLVPVYFVGVGESVEDLIPFNSREFAKSLIIN